MFKDLFRTKPKYITVRKPDISPDGKQEEKKELPDGLWIKCKSCNQIIYHKDLEQNLQVCTKCGYHFRISALQRIKQMTDTDSFHELYHDLAPVNPLEFPEYSEKLGKSQSTTGLKDAVVTGTAEINQNPCVIAAMDFFFLGGSMGSVVGEKITRAFEYASDQGLPMITVSASGGARMHEGILSLMQMAKTCQALNRLAEKGCVYISVLADPTTGGVFASFASQGDIIIAEPGALVGFAGARVIQQTIHQTLPSGFQTAEFLMEHGLIDLIVHRKELKQTLAKLLRFHQRRERLNVNG